MSGYVHVCTDIWRAQRHRLLGDEVTGGCEQCNMGGGDPSPVHLLALALCTFWDLVLLGNIGCQVTIMWPTVIVFPKLQALES